MSLRRISLMIEEEILKAVDDYRRVQAKIPSRSQAINDLLTYALKARGFLKQKLIEPAPAQT